MSEILPELFSILEPWQLATIMFFAFFTSIIHGGAGIAGGVLLAAALALIIDVKAILPILSVVLIISNVARTIFNIKDFHLKTFLFIGIPALPCLVTGTFVYGYLSSTAIALILGSTVILSIPIRRWAKHKKMHATPPMLMGAGGVYGILSSAAVGVGMLLVPFMLGAGLDRKSFVATLSVIALSTNVIRTGVFSGTNLLGMETIVLGVIIGLITIPGSWIGRKFLVKTTDSRHSTLVDVLTVICGLNFFWVALR